MIKTISRTQDTVLVVDDTLGLKTARADHPKWNDICQTFDLITYQGDSFVGPTQSLLDLMDLKTAVENYTIGRLSVCPTGVTYAGRLVHTLDAERVLAFMKDGLSYRPIANYIERKMKNPSARAIKEMYNFLEHKGMPLTIRGTFLAYKGVTMDFWSVRGNRDTVVLQGQVDSQGRILNTIGAVIEVERSSVDDNYQEGCSFGLHAGSLSYARGWGKRVVIVEIDPADVVSVPEDCSCQKLRCCKYTVIGDYTGPLPDTFTTEYEDEGVCHQCGSPDGDCSCCEEDSCESCGCDTGECACDQTPTCSCTENTGGDCICDERTPIGTAPVPPPVAEPIPNATGEVPVTPLVDSYQQAMDAADEHTESERAEFMPKQKETTRQQLGLDIASSTYVKLVGLLAEQLMVNADDITVGTRMSDGVLGMDSLDAVELTMAIEEEFGFEISDEEAEKGASATIGEICKYIDERLSNTDQYSIGSGDGVMDKHDGRKAKWIAGDQTGADSPQHANYIRGYVHGFSL